MGEPLRPTWLRLLRGLWLEWRINRWEGVAEFSAKRARKLRKRLAALAKRDAP